VGFCEFLVLKNFDCHDLLRSYVTHRNNCVESSWGWGRRYLVGNGCMWRWVIHLSDGLELSKNNGVLVGVPGRSETGNPNNFPIPLRSTGTAFGEVRLEKFRDTEYKKDQSKPFTLQLST
jgi:hypothetical protein